MSLLQVEMWVQPNSFKSEWKRLHIEKTSRLKFKPIKSLTFDLANGEKVTKTS